MATFFFDNDISFRIVRALKELVHGAELVALRDVYPVDAKDSQWIPEAGTNGWVVIS
jgi:predicted nuclease of predicted toxin-antitoxin system